MTDTACYLFSGGGSGGHLYPGIAVAENLRRRDPGCEIVFVGSERPVEQAILQPTGFEHHPLPVRSFQDLRRTPWRFLQGNWAAIRQARTILQSKQPRCVIGLGGFASAPAVWMASRLGLPIVLIEQNAIPGAATRWLARFAQRIGIAFEETRRHLPAGAPIILTGNPLRNSIATIDPERSHEHEQRTLLILGGSQGAESLNDAVTSLLSELQHDLRGWRIVHQTGAGRADQVRDQYRRWAKIIEEPTTESPADQSLSRAFVADFLPDMAEWYAKADLVISRAGATTLAELACAGCPSLLVPYPFAADQHQAANASAFVQAGAAVMIQQSTTAAETVNRLRGPLLDLLREETRRKLMGQAARKLARPDAAQRLTELVLEIQLPVRRGSPDPAASSQRSPDRCRCSSLESLIVKTGRETQSEVRRGQETRAERSR